MSLYRRPFGSCSWLILGLAAIGLGLAALQAQPVPGGAPKPKPLTPEQRTRLKESDRLWSEGHKLQAAGQLAEALAAAEKHLAIDRELFGGTHSRVAEDLQWLAELHEQREDFAAARKAREQVLAMRTKLHGGGDWRVTDARLELADLERLAGMTREQRAQLTQARRLNDQTVSLWRRGKNAQAIPLAKKALAIREARLSKDHPDVAQSLHNLALVYEALGRFAEAEPLYLRSLKIIEAARGQDHPDVAANLNNLAGLYSAVGRYAEAEPLLWRSLKVIEAARGQDHPEVAFSLNNLAGHYQVMGRYAEAEPLLRRSLKIRETRFGQDHPEVALALNNLAGLYRDMGRPAEAEPLFKRGLEIRQAALGPDHPAVATSLNDLALLYLDMGRPAEAEPLFKRGLKIREAALGPDHPAVATSLNNLAALYLDMGRRDEAEPLFRRSLKISEAKWGPDHPKVATSLNNLAALYQEMGRFAEAEPLCRKAIQVVEDYVRRTGAGLSERQLLLLAGKSRSFLDSYLSLADAARLPADGPYAAVLAWKGRAFAQQRQVQLARRLHRDGDPVTARLYEQLERASQQLAQLALAVPEKALAAAILDRRKQDLVRLSEEVDALQQKLADRSTAFRRLQQQARLTPAQLQKLLPQDAVLIDFLVYRHFSPPEAKKGRGTSRQRLAAFVVRPGRPIELVNLGPMQPIAEAVDDWRRNKGLGSAGKTDPAGAKLRQFVWQSLAAKVAGTRLVLVSPDGALGKFPFAALPGSKPGSYLLEEVALAVLPVPQLLPQLLAPADAADKAVPSLLLVGEVDYDAADAGAADATSRELPADMRSGVLGQAKPLAGTKAEVAAIKGFFQSRFPQAKLTDLRKQEPTEGAVRKEAPGHRYLHFATHGFFDPPKLRSALAEISRADGPSGFNLFGRQGVSAFHPGLLSGIVLAGANQETRPDEDDGILTALEVAALDLGGVELAVLSACQTGLGETAGGEGLLGLQRAFQVAGAHTVVASLWQVDDRATRVLMEDFYANLWRQKLTKLEALRQAQLTMLREGVQRVTLLDAVIAVVGTQSTVLRGGTKRGLGELEQPAGARRLPPYYWAAFVLSGDWR